MTPNEQTFARIAQHKKTYDLLTQICIAKIVDPAIITRADQYQSGVLATKRKYILREMKKQGATVRELQTVCPMTKRAIYGAVKI